MTESKVQLIDRRFKELSLLSRTQIESILASKNLGELQPWVYSGGQVHAILVSEFGKDEVQKYTVWQLNKMAPHDTPISVSGHVSHIKIK